MYARTYVCMHELMLISLVINNNDISDNHVSNRNVIKDTISEQVP